MKKDKMTGCEIITRNVKFESPERIGLRFNSLGVSDVYRIFVQSPMNNRDGQVKVTVKTKQRPGNKQLDEWGCLWGTSDEEANDMGQVIANPIKEWEELDEFIFPDPFLPERFDGLEEALAEAEYHGKYVQLNSPHCLFERMHFLRGFEELLLSLYTEPEKVEFLADKVIEYQIGIVKQAAALGKGRIHCFDTTDDWGSQKGMLISPALWRKIFKPRYKRLIDEIHNAGMHIRFHTDGNIKEVMTDFTDLGIDILNIHQPKLLNIATVGEMMRGKLCFEVSVDIQETLPSGNYELIYQEVKELIEHWATPDGGLIGVEYTNLGAIGAKKEGLEHELRAFIEYGSLK